MGMSQIPRLAGTKPSSSARRRHGFTLTELMVVVGLVAVLISLLFPVVAKVRVAANTAKCASNLRQMGLALTMYLSDNRGHAPDYIWHTPAFPDIAWHAYWPGILDDRGVKRNVLICPAACEPTSIVANRGYGDATHNWTGKYASNGSVVRFSDVEYRDGSYGYNHYLTAGGFAGNASSITALREPSHTPMFMDCVYVDTMPLNGSPMSPAPPPPDLTGARATPGSPEHWKFLISRHGRGINVGMADGSVAWIPLEQTYQLRWNNDWVPYLLTLPPT